MCQLSDRGLECGRRHPPSLYMPSRRRTDFLYQRQLARSMTSPMWLLPRALKEIFYITMQQLGEPCCRLDRQYDLFGGASANQVGLLVGLVRLPPFLSLQQMEFLVLLPLLLPATPAISPNSRSDYSLISKCFWSHRF